MKGWAYSEVKIARAYFCNARKPANWVQPQLDQGVVIGSRPATSNEEIMLGKPLSLAVAALGLGLLAAPATAAPTMNLKGVEVDTSAVEPAHYGRRCYYHRGHYHCRRAYYRRYYGYAPDYYPYYGYGPSIGFSFGGGHRHWGHRHHRHW